MIGNAFRTQRGATPAALAADLLALVADPAGAQARLDELNAAAARAGEVTERLRAVEGREEAVAAREQAADQREAELAQREAAIRAFREKLESMAQGLDRLRREDAAVGAA